MEDSELADLLISRLNCLILNENIKQDIQSLIESRIPCSESTKNHPIIQVQIVEGSHSSLGFLGLLNGLIGMMECTGLGYIAACYDDNGKLEKFCRTDLYRVTTS